MGFCQTVFKGFGAPPTPPGKILDLFSFFFFFFLMFFFLNYTRPPTRLAFFLEEKKKFGGFNIFFFKKTVKIQKKTPNFCYIMVGNPHSLMFSHKSAPQINNKIFFLLPFNYFLYLIFFLKGGVLFVFKLILGGTRPLLFFQVRSLYISLNLCIARFFIFFFFSKKNIEKK